MQKTGAGWQRHAAGAAPATAAVMQRAACGDLVAAGRPACVLERAWCGRRRQYLLCTCTRAEAWVVLPLTVMH